MLWSPGVLQRSFDWTPQQTGLVMGLVVLIGGSFGMLVGGRLSDRGLVAGRRDAALRIAMVSSVFGTVAFVALLWAQGSSAMATVAVFAVGVVLLAMPAGSCYAASQMVLPNQVRGQALALILLVIHAVLDVGIQRCSASVRALAPAARHDLVIQFVWLLTCTPIPLLYAAAPPELWSSGI
jgi:hypothetical protein